MKISRQRNRVSGTLQMLVLMLVLAGLICGLAAPARAAAPSPLDAFAPTINSTVRTIAQQPDGKILVAGGFNIINGTSCPHIARLNADGSVDATFNPGAGANAAVRVMALQPDGKVLLGGDFTGVNGKSRIRVARLNADGSLDTTFNPGTGANNTVFTLGVQPDGKVLLSGFFTTINGIARNHIARLNTDGSLDTAFDPAAGMGPNDSATAFVVQPDGKILLSGYISKVDGVTRNGIARLNANGTLDTTFISPLLKYASVNCLAVQPDGKLLIGGYQSEYSSYYIARLNANGSVDAAFNAGSGANNQVCAVSVQPDGKVLLGGWFTAINGKPCRHLARLNIDGSLDATFNPGTGTDSYVTTVVAAANGQILVGGDFATFNGTPRPRIARLNPDGSLEANFNPGTGAGDYVNALAVQPDGKLLLGGNFTTFNGTPLNRIARLNPGGSLDPAFYPFSGANAAVNALAVQPDGKLLLGGQFTTVNLSRRNRIARLNDDGTLDPAFYPGTGADGAVNAVALQADGKVLLGGSFTTINGTSCKGIARLNANGSPDATFNPGTGAGGTVFSLAVLPSGKVLVSGSFTSFNGTACGRIARLNANGSLDATFNPGTGANGTIMALALQPDGKVLLGGNFTQLGGASRNRIARLNANGSLDASFNPGTGANGWVYTMALQADGKILLGGWFTAFNGAVRNHLARLGANGALDPTFDPGAGPNASVSALALQGDGKVLLGGYFTQVNGVPLSCIARLSNTDPAQEALEVAPAGASVTWTLAGSSPQPFRVLFEHSDTGITWSTLGWGVAKPGVGYQLAGLHLPVSANHYLRATRWVAGGINSGSASLQRSVLRFYASTLIPPPQVTLIYKAGANGSISGVTTQTVTRGSSGTPVTAVPATGYHFVQWSDGRTDNPRTDASVTASMTVSALFAANPFTVTFRIDGTLGATLTGATRQTVYFGSDASPVTAHAPAGYVFVKWIKGAADYSTLNPLTVTHVAEDISLIAVFAHQ